MTDSSPYPDYPEAGIPPALSRAIELRNECGWPVTVARGADVPNRPLWDRDARARYPGKGLVRGVRRMTIFCRTASFPFSRFPDLEHLTVTRARAGHLDEIARLPKLRYLNLGTSLRDLDRLASVRTLQQIYMTHVDQLRSIDGLADLPDLRIISIEGSSNLTELPRFGAAAHSLRGLTLSHLLPGNTNVFRTFEPLRALANLRYLHLKTSVADASLRPLHELSELQYIDIARNSFTRAEIEALRAVMPGVAGNLHEESEYIGSRVGGRRASRR
jgi:hypothetical protein